MCLSPFLLVELPLETVVVSLLLLLGAVDVTDVATLVLVPLLVVIIGVVGRLPETDKGSWQSSTYNEKINSTCIILFVCSPSSYVYPSTYVSSISYSGGTCVSSTAVY